MYEKLLPKDKFDNSQIEALRNLREEDIKPLIPNLLTWLQDWNWPVAKDVLPLLMEREALVFPHIAGILAGDDEMWQYWILELLIPTFSQEHKNELKEPLERLMTLTGKDEGSLMIVDAATDCYQKCFVGHADTI